MTVLEKQVAEERAEVLASDDATEKSDRETEITENQEFEVEQQAEGEEPVKTECSAETEHAEEQESLSMEAETGMKR